MEGHLLEGLLLGLCSQDRISVAAACGCIRHAYMSRETSLAMTDLWTASFFCDILRAFPAYHDDPARMDTSLLRKSYGSCSVRLLDILPLVSFQGRLWEPCQLRSQLFEMQAASAINDDSS